MEKLDEGRTDWRPGLTTSRQCVGGEGNDSERSKSKIAKPSS